MTKWHQIKKHCTIKLKKDTPIIVFYCFFYAYVNIIIIIPRDVTLSTYVVVSEWIETGDSASNCWYLLG